MVVEVFERYIGTYENERGTVEQEVDNVGKDRVFRGLVEISVPGKGTTTGKGGQKVIATEQC